MINDGRVIVVGAGPAGISASIQLGRYGREVVLFEGAVPGGLLRNARLVENYPGFPGGIRGEDLADLFVRQLAGAGVAVINERVESLEYREKRGGGCFVAETGRTSRAAGLAVIASGTVPLPPADISIAEDARERIFFEVARSSGITGKRFAVMGGGDAAFDYALTLADENDVVIITRSETPRCLDLLVERCDRNSRIARLCGVSVERIVSKNGALELECAGSGECGGSGKEGRGGGAGAKARIETDYLMIAAGRRPDLDFLAPSVGENIDSLSAGGILYLAGDVCNGIFRQAAISAGDGLRAAMRIEKFMRGEKV